MAVFVLFLIHGYFHVHAYMATFHVVLLGEFHVESYKVYIHLYSSIYIGT